MNKSQLRQLIREEIKKSYSVNEGKNSWFDEFLSNNNAFWNELSKTKKTKPPNTFYNISIFRNPFFSNIGCNNHLPFDSCFFC